MLTRPVRTPGRAYSVGANARRGAAPCPTAYNIRRWILPHYGEQAATPTPKKQRGGRASGGHAWPLNIKCGWCWPGAGVPGQRRRAPGGGGAKPRAALAPPHQIRPERGGTRRAHRLFVLDSSGQASGVKKGPEGPLERVPYFPLFCVVVRYIFHAGLLYVGHCRGVKAA